MANETLNVNIQKRTEFKPISTIFLTLETLKETLQYLVVFVTTPSSREMYNMHITSYPFKETKRAH